MKQDIAIPQRFVVSHAKASDFGAHTFRPHLEMRDLGVAEATDGNVSIYVTRVTKGFDSNEEPGSHFHKPTFQYFYVLKGWQRMYFEGHGEELLEEGSGWLQATGLKHQVLDHSDDFEVLVINMPEKFETVTC